LLKETLTKNLNPIPKSKSYTIPLKNFQDPLKMYTLTRFQRLPFYFCRLNNIGTNQNYNTFHNFGSSIAL